MFLPRRRLSSLPCTHQPASPHWPGVCGHPDAPASTSYWIFLAVAGSALVACTWVREGLNLAGLCWEPLLLFNHVQCSFIFSTSRSLILVLKSLVPAREGSACPQSTSACKPPGKLDHLFGSVLVRRMGESGGFLTDLWDGSLSPVTYLLA